MKNYLVGLKNQIYVNLAHESEDFKEIIKDRPIKAFKIVLVIFSSYFFLVLYFFSYD